MLYEGITIMGAVNGTVVEEDIGGEHRLSIDQFHIIVEGGHPDITVVVA